MRRRYSHFPLFFRPAGFRIRGISRTPATTTSRTHKKNENRKKEEDCTPSQRWKHPHNIRVRQNPDRFSPLCYNNSSNPLLLESADYLVEFFIT